MPYKYVVIVFDPPEYGDDASYDKVLGVYDDKEIADKAASEFVMAFVEIVPYHKA